MYFVIRNYNVPYFAFPLGCYFFVSGCNSNMRYIFKCHIAVQIPTYDKIILFLILHYYPALDLLHECELNYGLQFMILNAYTIFKQPPSSQSVYL